MTTQILPPGPSPEAAERPVQERSGDDGFARVLDRADRGRRDVEPRDRHDPDRRVRHSDRGDERERVDREAPVERARDDRPERVTGDRDEREVDAVSTERSDETDAEVAEGREDAAASEELAPSVDEAPTTQHAANTDAESEDVVAEEDLLAVLGWVGVDAPTEPSTAAAPTGAQPASPVAAGDGLPGAAVVTEPTGAQPAVAAAAVDIDLSETAAEAIVEGDAAIASPPVAAAAASTAAAVDGAESDGPTIEEPLLTAPAAASSGADAETGTEADGSTGEQQPPPPPARVPEAATAAQAPTSTAVQPDAAAVATEVALDPMTPDLTTEPTAPVQSSGVAAPSSTGPVAGPSPMLPSGAVQRIMEVVEEIARQTPPRSMTVDLSDLEGVRVQVALDGAGVRIRVLDDMSGDARRQLERELARSLAERGFDLSHDGGAETRGGAGQQADRDDAYLPMSTGRILRPTPANGPAPLSDQRGVRL